jgi:hypothetical protein
MECVSISFGMTHAVSALRSKRAEIARRVHAVEDHLKRLRAALANIDAVLPLFEKEAADDPESILARPLHRRSRYFASGEVQHRCREALRKASVPLSALEIAAILMASKGLSPSDPQIRRYVANSVLPVLRRLVERSFAKKAGEGSATRWEIAR